MEVVDILKNNNYGIRICTTDDLIKIWLHELGISYSLTKYIFKSDESYHRLKKKCCFCRNNTTYYLYNGWHSHICSDLHTYRERITSNICSDCFEKAVSLVIYNKICVYQVIKTNTMLCDDVNNIIIDNFIHVIKYYTQLIGGFLDL